MPFRLAVAQSQVGLDHHENGREVRRLMRRARGEGARMVQFPEGAISGYPSGAGKQHFAGWPVDWAGLKAELEETAALAAELGLWVVAGCNHRLTPPHRPHNSLFVISDLGTIAARYDKRRISYSEVTDWYSPGADPVLFEAEGFRFGLALCIEINFPELFVDYAVRGADAILFSSYSEDPVFALLAQAYAAANTCWFGFAVPAQCSPAAAAGIIGPDGRWMARCPDDGASAIVTVTLDRDEPAFDMALKKARGWRAISRRGEVYDAVRVEDARSADRTRF